jgi:NitT/TauT family transport system substrate-binding protein
MTSNPLPEVRTPVHARSRHLQTALATLAIVVAACGSASPTGTPTTAATVPASASSASSASSSTNASAAPSAATSGAATALTVGLGYIPSVQFAPFYLAQQAGYYASAGLTVKLGNDIDPNLITKIGQGAIDIGEADGTSVIPAVSQGIPVVYTATLSGTFPDVVIAKQGSGIAAPADLRGKKIGIPGKYGSSWIMLQALLQSAGLTTNDVTIVEFPDFGQAAALQQGAVDAATGFLNNEPIVLKNAGINTVTLAVDSIVALPGPGLVTSRNTLAAKHDALAAFVKATLKAMDDITADPQKGLDATYAQVPDLAQNKPLQAQILAATIATWKDTRTNAAYGAIDTAGWQQSITFMTGLGLVPNPVTVDQLTDASLLP